MRDKKFKILSIDGGGIRGVFPAMFLAEIEAKMKAEGNEKWQIYQNFDFVCGTSTGGIIAIALSLGIPAKEIYELYYNNASKIFGNKKGLLTSFFKATHPRSELEKLIRTKFASANNGEDPRLLDCKIPTCVTIYDLQEGCPSVLKSKYHDKFLRDYHIPAYQAALATSAAPTYFNPYSADYVDLNGLQKPFHNKVDGGVFCNNPALTAIVEVQKAFNKKLENISVLSLGTGHQKFCDSGILKKYVWLANILKHYDLIRDSDRRRHYGIIYWMLSGGKKRLIELFMQGQSQQVQNLISLLQNGIDKQEQPNFIYQRVDTHLDESCNIQMDEINKFKLDKLAEKATREFQLTGNNIIRDFFSHK
ncbi:MAG: Patatin [Ferruginibacter sp.]|uniref:CBASS cGAMP-activated phospholipase n=1 Tax=Ferruginibacter sp. TaxID=1940288 RepID=UPI00265A0E6A|nr:CBASS cGAMP-activated phospholipase [Ferruginibacter sp.]MDB5277952.1 Patatin [Ferruginibacter sp.]